MHRRQIHIRHGTRRRHCTIGLLENTKAGGRFLFPVKAMSAVFKHKYMEGFLQLLKTENKNIDQSVRETLYSKSWIVYAKSPFGGPAQVIEYLGRYAHKVAISNHRIVSHIELQKVHCYSVRPLLPNPLL